VPLATAIWRADPPRKRAGPVASSQRQLAASRAVLTFAALYRPNSSIWAS